MILLTACSQSAPAIFQAGEDASGKAYVALMEKDQKLQILYHEEERVEALQGIDCKGIMKDSTSLSIILPEGRIQSTYPVSEEELLDREEAITEAGGNYGISAAAEIEGINLLKKQQEICQIVGNYPFFFAALMEDGRIIHWAFGKLVEHTDWSKVTSIAATETLLLGLCEDGTVVITSRK